MEGKRECLLQYCSLDILLASPYSSPTECTCEISTQIKKHNSTSALRKLSPALQSLFYSTAISLSWLLL